MVSDARYGDVAVAATIPGMVTNLPFRYVDGYFESGACFSCGAPVTGTSARVAHLRRHLDTARAAARQATHWG